MHKKVDDPKKLGGRYSTTLGAKRWPLRKPLIPQRAKSAAVLDLLASLALAKKVRLPGSFFEPCTSFVLTISKDVRYNEFFDFP